MCGCEIPILGGVSGEFEELGGEVLEDRGEVDGGAGSDSLGEPSLAKVSIAGGVVCENRAIDRAIRPTGNWSPALADREDLPPFWNIGCGISKASNANSLLEQSYSLR